MTANNDGDASQGNVDWAKEINDTLTPLESLRQLVAALEKLEPEGVETHEWAIAIRTIRDGVEIPRTVTSMGSALVLSALSDLLAKDISSRAMLQWATAPAPAPQEGQGAG